jgi:hypothetical protein
MYSSALGLIAKSDGMEVRKEETIDHTLNWMYKAILAMCISIAVGRVQIISIAVLLAFFIFWTWILTDIFTNGHLKKNLITYMGSSRTDMFFKYHFQNRALLVMWSTKIIAFTLASFLLFLRYQSII